jgi:hypothetical protein
VVYCTFTETAALELMVNVQLLVLLPPLEQAPDHTADRVSEMDSVIEVPGLNEALPLLPVGTLMPAGVEDTRSPDRPLAVTVRTSVCATGFTVSPTLAVTPSAFDFAVMVPVVALVTV